MHHRPDSMSTTRAATSIRISAFFDAGTIDHTRAITTRVQHQAPFGRIAANKAMSSSGDSRSTSLVPSPSLANLPLPNVSAVQHDNAGSRTLLPSRAMSSSAYVSPYPPIQNSTSSSGMPNASIAGMQTRTSNAQPSASALTATEPEQDPGLAQKLSLVEAINQHRINTIGELRRTERVFASLGSSDITQPMTAAWLYYVNSNSLLAELRSLTRNYPFRVAQDPSSNRSWNYCWLVLAKIHTDRLIPSYARSQASRREMWAGRNPDASSVDRLTAAFVQEWTTALAQLLRYWETPPVVPRS